MVEEPTAVTIRTRLRPNIVARLLHHRGGHNSCEKCRTAVERFRTDFVESFSCRSPIVRLSHRLVCGAVQLQQQSVYAEGAISRTIKVLLEFAPPSCRGGPGNSPQISVRHADCATPYLTVDADRRSMQQYCCCTCHATETKASPSSTHSSTPNQANNTIYTVRGSVHDQRRTEVGGTQLHTPRTQIGRDSCQLFALQQRQHQVDMFHSGVT